MSIYYRPEKAVLGDVIPFYDDGHFKPFYLRNFRSNRDREHRDSWVMLTTDDHVHYTEHDTHIVGGTGSVIKVDGMYHMFYCTFRMHPERNYINHAVSRDLDTWTDSLGIASLNTILNKLAEAGIPNSILNTVGRR